MIAYSRYYVEELIIYTDGSTLGNGQTGAKGGWAIWYPNGEFPDLNGYFRYGRQTNNRYELKAIMEAMRKSLRGGGVYDVIIRTDSHYAIDCLTSFIKKWKVNGWRNCKGAPVENAKLIQIIDSMITKMKSRGGNFTFEHVRGHEDDSDNVAVDRLAKAAALANPCREYC